jgi:hypothetical protein
MAPYGYAHTATRTITDAKDFHGAIELGSYSAVELLGVSATSYTFDATHDLFRLYQGNRVVDTVNLGASTGSIRVQSSSSSTGGWVYVGTGYRGLSYGIFSASLIQGYGCQSITGGGGSAGVGAGAPAAWRARTGALGRAELVSGRSR